MSNAGAFASWLDRLKAAGGKLPSRIRYLRKSTEDRKRQQYSLEGQHRALDVKFGRIDSLWVWRDSCSGRTFDREAFKDLVSFVESTDFEGPVELYDPSRFGRLVKHRRITGVERLVPDLVGYQAMLERFRDAGSEVVFRDLSMSGDPMLDAIQIVMHASVASQFTVDLGKVVTRGKIDALSGGYWGGGAAPLGAVRKDVATRRILKPGEKATPEGRVVLAPDPKTQPFWSVAVKAYLGGMSLENVGRMLARKGIRGGHGKVLGHTAVRNFLTSEALAGEIEYLGHEDAKGHRPLLRRRAAWPPLIDRELRARVLAELDRRGGRQQRRAPAADYPLVLHCAVCGRRYVGGRLTAKQGKPRVYQHPPRRDHDMGSCRQWCVAADCVEADLRELITAAITPSAVSRLRKALAAAGAGRRAGRAGAEAQARYDACDKEVERIIKTMRLVDTTEDRMRFDAVLADARKRRSDAHRALLKVQGKGEAEAPAGKRLRAEVDHTRLMLENWNSVSHADRRTVLDYWIDDAAVVVTPRASGNRAASIEVVVTLKHDPADRPHRMVVSRPPRKARKRLGIPVEEPTGRARRGSRRRKSERRDPPRRIAERPPQKYTTGLEVSRRE